MYWHLLKKLFWGASKNSLLRVFPPISWLLRLAQMTHYIEGFLYVYKLSSNGHCLVHFRHNHTITRTAKTKRNTKIKNNLLWSLPLLHVIIKGVIIGKLLTSIPVIVSTSFFHFYQIFVADCFYYFYLFYVVFFVYFIFFFCKTQIEYVKIVFTDHKHNKVKTTHIFKSAFLCTFCYKQNEQNVNSKLNIV